MAVVPQMVLLATLCFCISIYRVSGLKCYACVHITVNSDDTSVKKYFNGFASTITPKCANPLDPTADNVDERTCLAESDKVVKCATTDVKTLNVTYKNVTFSGTTFYRGCIQTGVGEDDTCFDANNTAKHQIEQFANELTVNSLTGTVCPCSAALCNGEPASTKSGNGNNAQGRITPEKVCWMIGLVLAIAVVRQL